MFKSKLHHTIATHVIAQLCYVINVNNKEMVNKTSEVAEAENI